jgi:hypothetical protein
MDNSSNFFLPIVVLLLFGVFPAAISVSDDDDDFLISRTIFVM